MENFFEDLKVWIEKKIEESVESKFEEMESRWRDSLQGAEMSETESPKQKEVETQATEPEEEEVESENLQNGLSDYAKDLYMFLRKYREEHKEEDPDATPSYAVLKDEADLPSNKVRDGYKELTEKGMIAREQKGRSKIVRFQAQS